jgi:tetratricopeptide (TPR) repeat protein
MDNLNPEIPAKGNLAGTTPIQRTITWLHISDLHLHSGKTIFQQEMMLERLLKDINKQCMKYTLRPDMIFITGDLVSAEEKGRDLAKQYQEATAFIDKICGIFSPQLHRNQVFIIPGNHDVDCETGEAEISAMYGKDLKDIEEILKSNSRDITAIMGRLAEYRVFVEKGGYGGDRSGNPMADFSQMMEAGGLKIGIAGFNSAWLYRRGKQYEKQLCMAGTAQYDLLFSKLQGSDFNIALIHHPGGHLAGKEENCFWRDIIRTRHFHFCLHGHCHESWISTTPGDIGHLTIAAGACYEKDDRFTGYNLVSINLEGACLDVHLRKYNRKSGGDWIPEVIPGVTDDDGIYHDSPKWLFRYGSLPQDQENIGASIAQKLIDALTKNQLGGFANEKISYSTTVGWANGKQNVNIVVNVDAGSPTDDQRDKIFHKVEQAIVSDDYKGALKLLDEMEKSCGKEMDNADYSSTILSLRGQASLAMGNIDKGIGFLEKSESFSRNAPPKRRILYALAKHLRGNRTEAFRIAEEIRAADKELHYPGARVVWVLSSASSSPVELESQLSKEELAHPLVMTALAEIAYSIPEYDLAERYARRALKLAPSEIQTMILLSSILMTRRLGNTVRYGYSLPHLSRIQWPESAEVIKLMRDSIARLKDNSAPSRTASLLANLALVHNALGNIPEAEECMGDAARLCPEDINLADRYLDCLEKQGKFKEVAIFCEEKPDILRPPCPILLRYAQCLLINGTPELFDKARKSLEAAFPFIYEFESLGKLWLIGLLGECWLDNGESEKLEDMLSQHEQDPLLVSMCFYLRAKLSIKKDDVIKGLSHLEYAFSKIPDDKIVRFAMLPKIAILFESSERDDLAWPCWRSLADDTVLDIAGRKFIQAAYKSREFQQIKDYCSRLRENGSYDYEQVRAEVIATEGLSSIEAEKLLGYLVTQHPCEAYRSQLQTWFWFIKVVNGNLSRGEVNIELLPQAEKLDDVHTGLRVVEVLKADGHPHEALHYAYLLYQKYPAEAEAHHALVFCLIPEHPGLSFPKIEFVGVDTAVTYAVEEDPVIHSIVIENTPCMNIDRNERHPDNSLVLRMLGKEVDETFVFSETPIRRMGKITAIEDKHVFRVRQCMVHLQELFPDKTRCWMFNINKGEGGQGVDSLLKVLRENREYLIGCDENFKAGVLPIHTYSRMTGLGLLRSIRHIGDSSDMRFIWSNGDADERRQMLQYMCDSKDLVVGPVALAVLIHIHAEGKISVPELFRSSGCRLLASEYSIHEFRSFLSNINVDNPTFSELLNGGHSNQTSQDDKKICVDRVLEIIDFINKEVQIISGNLQERHPDQGINDLINIVGRATVHSILEVKKNPDRVFWDDDAKSYNCAVQVFGGKCIPRVNTQAVLFFMRQMGYIEPEIMSDINITFLGLNCYFTSFDGLTIDLALRMSENEAATFPANRMLSLLSNSVVERHGLVRVVKEFLCTSWLGNSDRIAREGAILVFSALNSRKDGAGRSILCTAGNDAIEVLERTDKRKAKRLRTVMKGF